jgi:hypothetical protein
MLAKVSQILLREEQKEGIANHNISYLCSLPQQQTLVSPASHIHLDAQYGGFGKSTER